MLNVAELAVLGFAAARGTQLVVHDSILDAARSRLELWHARKFDSRSRTFWRDLIACIWCAGFWVSAITVLAYLFVTDSLGDTSFLTYGLSVFGVAGVQGAVNVYMDH
jgi:hypothetical protein